MAKSETQKELLSHFFGSQGTQLNRCLEPKMQCTKEAIRAHTVQNSRVLDLLSRDGHVLHLWWKFGSDERPTIKFKTVGRNKATTFAGLCAEHDAALFERIDKEAIDPPDHEQLFLLAYRAVIREFHATIDGASKIQACYQKRVELGLDPKNEPSSAGIEAVGHMIKSWLTFRYKYKMDIINARSDYPAFVSHYRILDCERPTVAASVFFGLETDSQTDEVQGVSMNILPLDNNRVLVAIGYLNEQRQFVENRIGDVLTADDGRFKYLCSKLLINYAENFVISPDYFDEWPNEKAEAVRCQFAKTMFEPDMETDSEHFHLL